MHDKVRLLHRVLYNTLDVRLAFVHHLCPKNVFHARFDLASIIGDLMVEDQTRALLGLQFIGYILRLPWEIVALPLIIKSCTPP